jgi:SAM-dependent methyltransferase
VLEHEVAAPGVSEATMAYRCAECCTNYPVIGGVPDFRLYPDPYIDLQADRRKALLLAEKARELTFKELVAYYYSITPEVPPDLGQYYLNHHLAGVKRGEGLLERFRRCGLKRPAPGELLLDLGCGTGGFLGAVSPLGVQAVGLDIALRWLIVAKKRLEELGCNQIQLVCACADVLPFATNRFDVVVAENLIEHVNNQSGLFSEIARVRLDNSRFYARTVNRFALGPEPHVGVWGVGYLPRALMNNYVKAIKGIPYEHIHLQSRANLLRSIAQSGQMDLRVMAPVLAEQDYEHHPPARRKIFQTYGELSRVPVLRPILTEIGPYLDITSMSETRTMPRHIVGAGRS